MEPLPPDPYLTLGVEKDADVAGIKSAYRKLVLKCHPDKIQDEALKAIKQDEFQRVQQAYEILSDDDKRRDYDDAFKLKKLRDELYRTTPHHSASRPSPKNYYEFNVRTAEPPPSFRAGPPPGPSPHSSYPGGGNPQYSASWDREIPTRSKMYDEARKARRTASHEKVQKDEDKEERRRRREAEEHKERERRRVERDREKEREREKREKQREREKADLKQAELEREKEARKEEARRLKKELDKREKKRDEQRRQEQEEKSRPRKPPYVEHHLESDEEPRPAKEELRTAKKKPSSGGIDGGSGSGSGSNKKHSDSSRRDKSTRRDESPFDGTTSSTQINMMQNISAAAEYMEHARRRGSKSGSTVQPSSYSSNFPNPDNWHLASDDVTRSRRPSQDDKKSSQPRVEVFEAEPEVVEVSPEARPPRLQKSYTSPIGTMPMPMPMPNSSAPRLSRAATMDYSRTPPQAPPAPSPEEKASGRHSSKSDHHRRRRPSFDEYDDHHSHHDHPRRAMPYPNVVRYKRGDDDLPAHVVEPRYRPVDEVFTPTPGSSAGAKATFPRVKIAPTFTSEQVYQNKAFNHLDVQWAAHTPPAQSSYHYTNAPYVSS